MRTSSLILPIALLAPLALTACNSEKHSGEEQANGVNMVIPPSETDVPEAPDEGSANTIAGNSAEVPANASVAPHPAKTAIPVAFHGRWGMVPGDCGPDMSIAKGLMTVNGEMLRFYESVGKPAVVTWPTPMMMKGTFHFTGEGQEWSKDMTLSVENGGKTLVRTEKDPAAKYSYTKCKS